MPSGKHTTAPERGIALTFDSTHGACPRCAGLPTLRVTDDTGRTIGFVAADWPWDAPVPQDPALHPDTPHYVVEWFGKDSEGRELPGIRAEDPYFIALTIQRHAQRVVAAAA